MNFPYDSLARFVACLFVIALLLAAKLPALRRFERHALALTAVVGILAFYNFGFIHHRQDDSFINHWEQFHYQLGSKFFPELGFDGLYAASFAARNETHPESKLSPTIRHLPSYELSDSAGYGSFAHEVRSRFEPERWREFVADHAYYVDSTRRPFLRRVWHDHGYNPSPTWTFVARAAGAWLPASWGSLTLLAGLDVLLLVGVFALLFSTYGYRAGCLGLAVFGLASGWPYIYVGAFLRLDWLLAVVAGVCLLERRRFAWAGVCFGYAAMVRLFPILFLAGPLLLASKSLLRGARPRWALELGAGLGAVLLLGVAAGSATGRGPGVWPEFAKRMEAYQSFWAENMVGLDTVVARPSYVVTNLMASHAPYYEERIGMQDLTERRWQRLAAKLALLALVVAAMWNASIPQSAILGMFAIFAILHPGSYYWIMLLLVPALAVPGAALTLLIVWMISHAVAYTYNNAAYQQVWNAIDAWGLLLVCVIVTLHFVRGRSLPTVGESSTS